MDNIENKKDLATTVDGLRSTCNLTEVILKGKDIELLLLKKDVQKKLSSLNDIDIKTLPNTINKQVSVQLLFMFSQAAWGSTIEWLRFLLVPFIYLNVSEMCLKEERTLNRAAKYVVHQDHLKFVNPF